jgi:hypothetical protein
MVPFCTFRAREFTHAAKLAGLPAKTNRVISDMPADVVPREHSPASAAQKGTVFSCLFLCMASVDGILYTGSYK